MKVMFHFGRNSKTSQPSLERVLCRAGAREVVTMPWGTILWSASRTLGDSTLMSFARATIRAGEEAPRHRHPNCDEILHLLSGHVEHSLGDESFILEPGDTISIPTGTWHHASVLGDEDADLVSCYSSADRETEFEAAPHFEGVSLP